MLFASRLLRPSSKNALLTWKIMTIRAVLVPPSGQGRNCNRMYFLNGLHFGSGMIASLVRFMKYSDVSVTPVGDVDVLKTTFFPVRGFNNHTFSEFCANVYFSLCFSSLRCNRPPPPLPPISLYFIIQLEEVGTK